MTSPSPLLTFLLPHRFADVYFLVGTGKDQRRIPAHRVVLAAASDIFEAMLSPVVFPEDVKDQKGGADAKAAPPGPGLTPADKEQEIGT
jgi:hypothetical protein